jgi:ubiquinone/menaquinone biosynthesis C-methylase UbiE
MRVIDCPCGATASRVLEVGCGTGELAKALDAAGYVFSY